MIADQHFSLKTTISVVFLCILLGANPVAVKISLKGFGPFTNAAVRFAIASVCILIWARITRQPLKIKKNLWAPVFAVSAILFIQISLFYFGMNRTCASHGALIANLMPFFVLILSHSFLPDDRMTLKKIVGMGAGFSGIYLIMNDTPQIRSDFIIGDLLLLAAVFMWACRIVFTKRIIHDFEPFQLVVYPFVFASVLFLICGFLWDPEMVTGVDLPIVSALFYQSVVIASIGFVIWNNLLKRHGATALHSFGFVTPVAGVCWGWLILQEAMTPRLLWALVLVAGGLVIFHFKRPARV